MKDESVVTAARLVDAIQVKLYMSLVVAWLNGMFGGHLERDKLLPLAIALEQVARHLRQLDLEKGFDVTYVELRLKDGDSERG